MAAASAAMMIESVAATVAMGAEATTVAEVTLVSDAAATLAATQSAANGGPVGDDESARFPLPLLAGGLSNRTMRTSMHCP